MGPEGHVAVGRNQFVKLEDPPNMAEGIPPPDTKGWAIRRKAIGTYALEIGIISLENTCQRFGIISLEEFEPRRRLIGRQGIGGLRVMRLA